MQLLWGAIGALALIACGGGREGGGGTDGGIVLMDGGPTGADSGDPSPDAGAVTECPPVVTDPPAGMICAASTYECLMGAADQAAAQDCIDADPMAEACDGCIQEEIVACATSNGCDDEAGNLECCAADNCTGAANVTACVQDMCSAELNGFIECVNGNISAGTCGITPLCFMSGS